MGKLIVGSKVVSEPGARITITRLEPSKEAAAGLNAGKGAKFPIDQKPAPVVDDFMAGVFYTGLSFVILIALFLLFR